jgi:molecular chaperone DnaK
VTAPIIGIDLGTTNSVVAHTDPAGTVTVLTDETGARIVPSVVHYDQGGKVVVGTYARRYLSVEPARVASIFKRGMGTPTFLPNGKEFVVDGKARTPEELSSWVLKKLGAMASEHFGEPVTKAVITVPHYFGEPERKATRNAGEIAGLEVLQIVNEPTAAALAHGYEGDAVEGTLLVFDLGGGTFDVTLMRHGASGEMEVIATGGDRQLGGADFDAAIFAWMADQVKEQTGIDLSAEPTNEDELRDRSNAIQAAEQMKIELSGRPQANGQLAVGGRSVQLVLSREEFEGLIAEQVGLVEDAVLVTLDKVDLEGTDVTTALMVGGSSRIPLFQAMVERITGKKPELTKNLDEDVARGAALFAAKLGGSLDPRSELALRPDPVDAAPHALGISVVDPRDRSRLINQVVIPEATPTPHASTHSFETAFDAQSDVRLQLNEGADQDLDFTRQLDESTGHFPNPVPLGHPLRCEIEYTADQLIRVHLFDGATQELLTEIEVEHKGLLSQSERDAARDYLRRTELE